MHKNNFGFLRLLFATLVIVSHSAEIIDGNRSRELLTSIGGHLTFGEFAVDAFFIISGYLVLSSFENSATVFSYLIKRVRRIYPGFLVAYAVCVFLLGPFVSADLKSLSVFGYFRLIIDALTLNGPTLSAFPGLPAHSLNGSMWTILYEFKCYLYVILAAAFGLYRKPAALVIVTAALLVSNEIHWPTYIGPLAKIVGSPTLFIRLEGLFCAGGCFYLLRSRIQYNWPLAAGAAVTLAICIYNSVFPEAAIAVFGGYLIFWTALHVKSSFLARINNRNDISYGVYLYAWPLQCTLAYYLDVHSPWALIAMTIPLSYAAGFISWRYVEKPFLRAKVPPDFKIGEITHS